MAEEELAKVENNESDNGGSDNGGSDNGRRGNGLRGLGKWETAKVTMAEDDSGRGTGNRTIGGNGGREKLRKKVLAGGEAGGR